MNTDDRLTKGHLYTELPHSPSDTLEKNVTKWLYITHKY